MSQLEVLVQKIAAQTATSPGAEIVVSLEDFFAGNTDPGSIGANLGSEQPAIDEFYRVLAGIRARPEVQDVLVRIYGQEDADSWPHTDTVYILTSGSAAQVEEWVAPLLPDEVNAEWMYGKPAAAPDTKEGMTAYSIWWD